MMAAAMTSGGRGFRIDQAEILTAMEYPTLSSENSVHLTVGRRQTRTRSPHDCNHPPVLPHAVRQLQVATAPGSRILRHQLNVLRQHAPRLLAPSSKRDEDMNAL